MEVTLKKILAVDDNNDILEFIASVLEDIDVDLITASDGEEGLMKAKKELPDLILLDVEMPKMDGFTVFKALRSFPATQNIPVIILTGIEKRTGFQFSKEDMGIFYGSEPELYLDKPINPEKLLENVNKLI
jgi:CheY-like chemotaxis protein